jgi:hypothetical protein
MIDSLDHFTMVECVPEMLARAKKEAGCGYCNPTVFAVVPNNP